MKHHCLTGSYCKHMPNFPLGALGGIRSDQGVIQSVIHFEEVVTFH